MLVRGTITEGRSSQISATIACTAAHDPLTKRLTSFERKEKKDTRQILLPLEHQLWNNETMMVFIPKTKGNLKQMASHEILLLYD
jgi:hypothetical protein